MAYEIKTQNGEVFQHKGSPVFGSDMINTVVAKKVNIDARLMDMIGSTEQKDRDGDVLTTSGWILEDFLKNPVFLWAHDYAGVPLAAVGSVVKKNKPEPHLYFKDIRYPRKGLFPFADMILELYGEKIINASSVGFLPYGWEDIEQKEDDAPSHFKGRKYTKQLLLELSGCAVPSNPGALQNQLDVYAQKSFSGVPGEELTKYVMKGNILVPDKADDILEDLNIKALEIIDGDAPKIHQVPILLPDEEVEVILEKGSFEAEDGEEFIVGACAIRQMDQKVIGQTIFKNLNIEDLEVEASSYLYDIYAKFLDCPIKDIYSRELAFPHPLVGTALKGIKQWTEDSLNKKEIVKIDIRNLTRGGEIPPVYDEIDLNSKQVIEAMVYGTYFVKGGKKAEDIIMRLQPSWNGLNLETYADINSKKRMKDIVGYIQEYVDKNNFLKGEKFALTGEFLKDSNTKWDDLILDKNIIDPVKRNVDLMIKKGSDFASRGLLFAGPPGTGKTLTGRAIKDESKEATFIWVSSKDFAHMNEVFAIRMAFSMARKLAPTVLFLEDIDQWMNGFMIDIFKTEMDGIDVNKGVLTILTSNRPNKLPRSIIDRPGRFHEVLLFDLPNDKLREEMMMKWGVESPSAELIKQTKGLSGAHLKEVFELAKQISEEEQMLLADSLMKALKKVLEQRQLIGRLEDYDNMSIQQEKVIESVVPQLPAIKLEEVLGDNDDSFYDEILSAPAETIPEFKRKEVSGAVSVEALLKLTEEVRKIKQTLNQI